MVSWYLILGISSGFEEGGGEIVLLMRPVPVVSYNLAVASER